MHADRHRRRRRRDRIAERVNIEAAGGGQRGDLGAIDRGKIAEEFFRAVIDAGNGIPGAAPKMHGRWRRQGHLGERLGVVAEKAILIKRDRPLPRHFAGHQRRGEGEFLTLLVAEGEARLADALWAERGWMMFSSSGTTGTPRVFRYSHIDRELWAWA